MEQAITATMQQMRLHLQLTLVADPQTWFTKLKQRFVVQSNRHHLLHLIWPRLDEITHGRDYVCERFCNLHATKYPGRLRADESLSLASYGKKPIGALLDRRPSHLMNEMLALLPSRCNKDNSIFLGIFLRKLPATTRDYLNTANRKTDAAVSSRGHP